MTTPSGSPAPRRVVIGARSWEELAAYLRERRPDLEYRGAPHTKITAADLQWGDSYLGFKRPPVEDWGGIRWIHCTGAGVDAFLLGTTLPANIVLTRTSEPFGPQIAEYCLARALAFTQELRQLDRQQHDHRWEQPFIRTLAGSRVLIVGTGEVGAAIGRSFAAAGCDVRGVSRTGKATAPFREVWPVDELADHVADADWLVLALPATGETHHLVNREVLSRCRGAILLNVGRGTVLEESALPEALDAGWLRGAALDVFETEPLPASSPLWDRDDVFVTPHIAGLTTIPGAGDSFLETLGSLERGETPIGLVDRRRGY